MALRRWTTRSRILNAQSGPAVLVLILASMVTADAQLPIVVAIDEGHFNVHTAETTYQPFANLAKDDGFMVSRHIGPLTPESLASVRVLVISNARSAAGGPLEDRGRPAFHADELDTVIAWVRGGGSLLLVIDHYPIGGANRELGQRLGLDLLDGRTEDSLLQQEELHGRVAAAGGSLTTADGLVFDRRTNRIGDHPITCGRSNAERIDRVATFGGASLNVPQGGSALLKFSDKAIDYVGQARTPRTAAGRNQAVAFVLGGGKVAALGEAAMLRNLDQSTVQNRQFALNLLRWLAGRLDIDQPSGCAPARSWGV